MGSPFEDAFKLPTISELAGMTEMSDEIESMPAELEIKHDKLVKKLEDIMVDVEGLEQHDVDMDDIAEEAQDTYDKLMDLGFNVETKYASGIFSTALRALELKAEMKISKAEKRLRLLKLHIDAKRIERDIKGQDGYNEDDSGGLAFNARSALAKIRNRT